MISGGTGVPLRVIHVLGGRGGIGGAERVVAALADSGGAIDHRIIVPFAPERATRPLVEMVAGTPVHAGGFVGLRQLPSARAWVRDRIARSEADVVHAHLFHAAALVASLPARSLPASVLTHHHGPLFRRQGRSLSALVDRWSGRRFDRVVAVSRSVSGFLEEEYGYPASRIELIPNGWAGEPLPRRVERPEFLCVGRLREEKGHRFLLRAFAEVCRVQPDARLRLVGGGPLRGELERLARSEGIAASVEFVGDVADVWTYYATAEVVVVPSLVETQGIVVLEAMAAGCPIIATRVGGIPEVVRDGITGRLVPPRDEASLAAAMLEIHRSSDLRDAFAEAGLKLADLWRMDRTVVSYESLYGRLVDRHHSGT